MTLTYFKMSSGEEMIAQVKETFHDRMVVEKPVMILLIPSPYKPQQVSVNMVGFIPTKQLFNKAMNLRIANILLDVELDAEDPLTSKYYRIIEMYEKMPSNPEKELITEDSASDTDTPEEEEDDTSKGWMN